MTELYFLKTEEISAIPETYFQECFPKRLERSRKFRFREDRLRCLGAGILLSEVCGAREDELFAGPQGKPYLSGTERKFNLSHSGEYAVLAVSGTEVGVDIEQHSERHMDVAKRVFQPEELEWMQEDPTERFYRLWTLKESVMKACGKGFALPPESFSVLPLIGGKSIRIADERYYASSVCSIPGYGCAVCGTEKNIPVLYRLRVENGKFETVPCQF